jgi:hypothetical protein
MFSVGNWIPGEGGMLLEIVGDAVLVDFLGQVRTAGEKGSPVKLARWVALKHAPTMLLTIYSLRA